MTGAAGHRRVGFLELARGLALAAPRLPRAVGALAVALRSDPNASGSIGAVLEENASRRPHAIALRCGAQAIPHGELNARVNRTARAFVAAGVTKGDAVALLMENRPELLVVVGALAKIGAIPALLNTSQRGRVLAHSIRAAEARWAVVGDELWSAFRAVRAEVELDDKARVWRVTDQPLSCGASRDAVVGPTQRRVGARDLGGESVGLDASNPPSTATVRRGDPCFYVFTSGTTGLPKASVMTHTRWLKAGAAFGGAMLALDAADVVYAPLPLYHNQALTVAWSSAATFGACLAIRRGFSASSFWDDCRRVGATSVVYIGEIPRYLLAQPPNDDDRRHGVRQMVGVGLRTDVWLPFKSRFGVERIFESYAASESNTVFLNALNIDGTVGFCPTPHALVRFDIERGEPVRDAQGRLVRARDGEVGLLIAKVTPKFSYDGYTDPQASEKKLIRGAFSDGDLWYDSGDLLRKVGYGHAEFVDRVGDTFRWKSENVATSEVELVVNQVPGVQESTVCGVQVPGAEGRAGLVAVVPELGATVDLNALLSRCREELPPYAVPLFVRLRDNLAVTGTFKHQKAQLRDEGIDPAQVSDALFVLLPGEGAYLPLTPEIAATLHTQRW